MTPALPLWQQSSLQRPFPAWRQTPPQRLFPCGTGPAKRHIAAGVVAFSWATAAVVNIRAAIKPIIAEKILLFMVVTSLSYRRKKTSAETVKPKSPFSVSYKGSCHGLTKHLAYRRPNFFLNTNLISNCGLSRSPAASLSLRHNGRTTRADMNTGLPFFEYWIRPINLRSPFN